MSELPHTPIQIVNYPSPDHPAARVTLEQALRYQATQRFIVPRTPFFQRIADLCGEEQQAIFEPGCGTGGFLEFWAAGARRSGFAGRTDSSSLLGCDISSAMVGLAASRLRLGSTSVRLVSGVDALDLQSQFYHHEIPAGGFSLVVLSQFEHCAPNDPESPLARQLRALGLRAMTKSDLRRFLWSLLRPGGWLFVIDDFRAADVEDEAAWSQAWDRHVVRQFADRSVIDLVAAQDAVTAQCLARHYGLERPEHQRFALARRARERRRIRNFEETQRLNDARRDFSEIFGPKNIGVEPHPSAATHPQFFLLWGRRNPGIH
jgi:SAM-dependent methyltransferase